MVEPLSLNFRVFTANFLASENLGTLWYYLKEASIEPRQEKNFGVSNQVRYKPGLTTTEDDF